MGIEFFCHWISGKCSMVELVAYGLDIPLDMKPIDIFHTEETIAGRLQVNVNINKWGRVRYFSGKSECGTPTIVIDDEIVSSDTQSILKYLCVNYSKESSTLYPTEPEKRELVNTRLFFLLDSLDHEFMEAYYRGLIVRRQPVDLEKIENLMEILSEVESYLSPPAENEYICGDNLTIADICFAVTLSELEAVHFDLSKFGRLTQHLQKCKGTIAGWDNIGKVGAERFGKWFEATSKAVECGGCPYMPVKRVVDYFVEESSDLQLFIDWTTTKATAVHLLVKHLDVEVVLKRTDLFHSEENAEKRKEVDENWKAMLMHISTTDNDDVDSPPIIVDKMKVITEIPPIMTYLVKTYSQEDTLYPGEDSEMRAMIDDLILDCDNLDQHVVDTYYLSDLSVKPSLDSEKVDKINEALEGIEGSLEEDRFIGGGSALTIADFLWAVTISKLEAVEHDMSKFPKVMAYLEKCKKNMSGWEEVGQPSANNFGEWKRCAWEWAENGNCPYYQGELPKES